MFLYLLWAQFSQLFLHASCCCCALCKSLLLSKALYLLWPGRTCPALPAGKPVEWLWSSSFDSFSPTPLTLFYAPHFIQNRISELNCDLQPKRCKSMKISNYTWAIKTQSGLLVCHQNHFMAFQAQFSTSEHAYCWLAPHYLPALSLPWVGSSTSKLIVTYQEYLDHQMHQIL